jgi:hypothetical protein
MLNDPQQLQTTQLPIDQFKQNLEPIVAEFIERHVKKFETVSDIRYFIYR